jgi:3-oxoacyl-[acyl-carrier-protein] synthase-1
MSRTPEPSPGGDKTKSSLAGPIAITGIGLVTSLGMDATISCAAARAGIVRSGEMEDFPVRCLLDGSVSGLVGHCASTTTAGFEGEARLLRLMHAALEDLRSGPAVETWERRRTGFYLSMPDPLRNLEGIAWLPTELARVTKMEQAAEQRKNAGRDHDGPLRMLRKAASLAGFGSDATLLGVVRSGRTGLAEIAARAAADLATGRIDVAFVGAVDSMLDEETVTWLADTGRLKTINQPLGLQPGEAAGFLALESPHRPPGQDHFVLGLLESVCQASEPASWSAAQAPPLGVGLATAVTAALSGVEAPVPWLIIDHAGDSYSAIDWGHALARLRARRTSPGPGALWYPALSFGETGAAYGAVAACLALRAFARRYAPSRNAVVAASSGGPGRWTFRLTSASNAVGRA